MTTTDPLAEALARLAAGAWVAPAAQSSVELSQTAKGATTVTVKTYAATADEAAATAQRVYDELVCRYASPTV